MHVLYRGSHPDERKGGRRQRRLNLHAGLYIFRPPSKSVTSNAEPKLRIDALTEEKGEYCPTWTISKRIRHISGSENFGLIEDVWYDHKRVDGVSGSAGSIVVT